MFSLVLLLEFGIVHGDIIHGTVGTVDGDGTIGIAGTDLGDGTIGTVGTVALIMVGGIIFTTEMYFMEITGDGTIGTIMDGTMATIGIMVKTIPTKHMVVEKVVH